MNCFKSVWLAMALLLAGQPAMAQSASDGAPNEQRDDDAQAEQAQQPDAPARAMERLVVTAGRQEQALLETSRPTTLVTGEDLRSIGAAIVTDALRGTAGVFVQQTTPGQGIPIVRGLKGSEVLHLVDGFRLNNAFFRNAPSQYFALVDPLNVDAVEVVRGPASTLYGSDALGGAVQLLTRRPEPRSGAEPWHEGRVVGRFASANNELLGHAELVGGWGDSAIKLSATYQDVGNRRTGFGERIRPSDYTARAGSATWVWQPSAVDELTVDLQYLNQPNTPRVDELVVGFGQTEPASEVFQFEPNNRLFGKVRYERAQPFALADRFVLQVGWQQIKDDRRARDTGDPVERRERNESELFGTTLELDKRLGDHLLTYGFEAYLDKVRSTRFETNLDTGEFNQVAARFPDGSEFNSFALYIHDEWQVLPWLRADFGLRYSFYDINLASNFGTPTANINPDDLTGNLSLIWSLNDQHRLITGISRGFRAPNIFDLGTLGERPGNRFNIASQNLGPEQIWTYDFGWRFQNQSVAAEVFLYYSDASDLITSQLTGDVTDSGRFIVQSANLNSAELYGVEGGLDWFVGRNWSVNAVFNYVRATENAVDGTTTPGDRIPPLNGRLGLVWQPSSQWRVEPYLFAAADQNRLSDRDIRDSRIDPNGTPGFVTLNVHATWSPNPRLDIRLRLENITDNGFREHGSGIDAPGINAAIEIEQRF